MPLNIALPWSESEHTLPSKDQHVLSSAACPRRIASYPLQRVCLKGKGPHLAQWHKAEDASKANDEHEANELAQIGLEHIWRKVFGRVQVQPSSVWHVRAVSLEVGSPVHTQQE